MANMHQEGMAITPEMEATLRAQAEANAKLLGASKFNPSQFKMDIDRFKAT